MATHAFGGSTRTSEPSPVAWCSRLRSVAPLSTSQQPKPPSSKSRPWSTLARDAWQASQVELRGQYSVERMLALSSYDRQSSKTRVAAALVLTFAPCLLAVMLLESFPLAPIELGLAHSHNFWIRSAFATYFISHSITTQLAIHSKALELSRWRIIAISSVTSLFQVPALLAMTLLIGFPMPFFTMVGMAPWFTIFIIVVTCTIHRQVRQDRSILGDVRKYALLATVQVVLILVYPAYTYVFNQLDAQSQTAFTILLPIIKLILKNIFALVSRNIEDVRPELVVFNVEIYSALYVSSCMQSAASPYTTLVIMGMDFVQACLAIKDLDDVLEDGELRRLLQPHHSATTDYRHVLVPLTVHLLANNPEVRNHRSIQIRSCLGQFTTRSFTSLSPINRAPVVVPLAPTAAASPGIDSTLPPLSPVTIPQREASTNRRKLTVQHRLQSFISHWSNQQPLNTNETQLHLIAARLSTTEQLHVVRKTLQILHIAEFVALVEYAEVFVPIVYSLFCVIAYTFPNTAYYSMLATLTPRQFAETLASVLLYGLLELVSFVALGVVVWRKFRVSVFTQCAFVLESQWGMVQSKLTLWLVVVLQFALSHYGNDFSFKFAWLQRAS